MIRLTLTMPPPSLNKYLRMHGGVKRRLRKRIGWALAQAWTDATGCGLPAAAPDRRIRRAATIYRPRRLDDDNATGSLKPLVDAMRDIKLLKNDSPRWLELEKPRQVIDRAHPRVEIEYEEDGKP